MIQQKVMISPKKTNRETKRCQVQITQNLPMKVVDNSPFLVFFLTLDHAIITDNPAKSNDIPLKKLDREIKVPSRNHFFFKKNLNMKVEGNSPFAVFFTLDPPTTKSALPVRCNIFKNISALLFLSRCFSSLSPPAFNASTDFADSGPVFTPSEAIFTVSDPVLALSKPIFAVSVPNFPSPEGTSSLFRRSLITGGGGMICGGGGGVGGPLQVAPGWSLLSSSLDSSRADLTLVSGAGRLLSLRRGFLMENRRRAGNNKLKE